MKTTFTPEEKINFIYGLSSKAERALIDKAMETDEDFRAEIAELQQSVGLLSEVDFDKAPTLNATRVISRSRPRWQGQALSIVKYAAAMLITFLALGSISNLNIQYNENGFQIAMGLVPAKTEIIEPNNGISAEALRVYQEQNALLLAEILAQERAEQQRQLTELFTDYATMIENRRMIDLQLIQYELENMQEANDTRLHNTDRVLYSLIEALSYND
jgi:ferric-dicitrate binding protein FerR (iron transport regulator)